MAATLLLIFSTLESRAGERVVPEPGGDDSRVLLPVPNRRPPVIHVTVALRSSRVANVASVHHHLRERCPIGHPGDRGRVQPDGKSNSQEHGKTDETSLDLTD